MSQKLASKGIFFGAISGKIMRQNEKVLAQVFKVFRCEILFVLGARFGGGYARKLSDIITLLKKMPSEESFSGG